MTTGSAGAGRRRSRRERRLRCGRWRRRRRSRRRGRCDRRRGRGRRRQRFGPADGLGVLEHLRREDQLQRHQAAGGRDGFERPQGCRLPVRQHRRGVVAGNARRFRQHHGRYVRMARRHAGDRGLHPRPGSQGGHLHRRRQATDAATTTRRVVRPRRTPAPRGTTTRTSCSSRSGASTSSRSTGAAATPRASTRRPRIRRSATRSRRRPRRRDGRWCCRSATGAIRAPGTGRRACRRCGAPARTSSTSASRRIMDRVLGNFDSAQHAAAQSPGHYNDPDMLIVGMSGFTSRKTEPTWRCGRSRARRSSPGTTSPP